MLTQLERPGVAAAQVAELAEQLRLPSGFGDDALVEPLLARCLGFAIGFLEARTGRALAQRRFRWTTRGWDEIGRCEIPLVPVRSIDAFALIDGAADRFVVDPAAIRIETLGFSTLLVARDTGLLPRIPREGVAEIDLTAGFGPEWIDVPVDLRQATLLMAAEAFNEPGAGAAPPIGVLRLIEPYRQVRL